MKVAGKPFAVQVNLKAADALAKKIRATKVRAFGNAISLFRPSMDAQPGGKAAW